MDVPFEKTDDTSALLRTTALGAGLEPETLVLLGVGARRVRVQTGEAIYRYGDTATTAHVLLAGRVEVLATDRIGDESVVAHIGLGEEFGALSVFESGRRLATAVAAEESELLVIEGEALRQAVEASKQLAFNLFSGFGRQMKQVMNLHRGDRPATRIALIRARGTEMFVDALATGIAAYEQTIVRDHQPVGADLPHGHRQLFEWASDRLTAPSPDHLAAFDRIVWVAPTDARPLVEQSVWAATAHNPALITKARIVWLLNSNERIGPTTSSTPGVRDYKIPAPGGGTPSASYRRAVGRVVRDLLGLKRGLALSGGGAKGMAHLGVLRAFDRAGIDFDMMTGTSGGALAGIPYAAGYDPDFCVAKFARDLATPWLFRCLPRGRNLFLLWCFRTGRFDGMLRPYLHHWKLDQLPIPFAAVAVDLVTGRDVVRDSGDAVHAILESINIPGVALPIIRGDQALTDGGVMNNLPSDVLVAKGAGIVVGVDVSRRMQCEFAGLTPGRPTAARPWSMETIFRVLEVLSSDTTARRARSADLVIEADTAAFHYADFDQTTALADAGERAAEEAIPRLREALDTFEKRVLAG
jgi:predicted acylesterase/phospholipase RssA/CRP-like cAMP-binding protein